MFGNRCRNAFAAVLGGVMCHITFNVERCLCVRGEQCCMVLLLIRCCTCKCVVRVKQRTAAQHKLTSEGADNCGQDHITPQLGRLLSTQQ